MSETLRWSPSSDYFRMGCCGSFVGRSGGSRFRYLPNDKGALVRLKLVSIELRNFRSHEHLVLPFSDGITAIIGDSGSGKSSILEGVAYALYGSAAISKNVDSLLWNQAGPRDKPTVWLTVEVNGDPFVVFRTPGKAAIFAAGTQDASKSDLVGGDAAVTSHVEEHFTGMSRVEFLSTYLAMQKDLEWLGGSGGTDRQRFLSRTLGYDRIQQGQKSLRSQAQERAAVVSYLEEKQAEVPDDLEDQLSVVKERFTHHAKQCGMWTAELKRLEKRLSAAREDLEELDVLRKKNTDVALDRVKVAEAVRFNRQRLEDLDTEISESELSLGLTCTYEADVERLSDLERESVASLRVAQESEMLAISTQVELATKAEERAFQRDSVESMGPNVACMTCRQILGDRFKDVQIWLNIETGVAEAAAEEARATVLKARYKVSVCEEGHVEFAHLLSVARSSRDLTLKSEVQLRKLRFTRESHEAERCDLQNDLADLDKWLEESEYQPQAVEEASDRVRLLTDSVTTTRDGLEEHRPLRDAATIEVVKLEALAEDAEQSSQELAEAREGRLLYQTTDKALTALRGRLNDAVRPILSSLATQFVTEMTSGWFSGLELDPKYQPVLYANGEVVPAPSGGEEDIANLAVRLAVSTLISQRSGLPVSVLALDEVFGAQNEARQRLVMEGLRSLSENRFSQVILITHTLLARDAADVIVRVERESPDVPSSVTVEDMR